MKSFGEVLPKTLPGNTSEFQARPRLSLNSPCSILPSPYAQAPKREHELIVRVCVQQTIQSMIDVKIPIVIACVRN